MLFSNDIDQPLLMVVSPPRLTSLLFLYIFSSIPQVKYHLFQEVFSQAKLAVPLLFSHNTLLSPVMAFLILY